MLSAIACTTTSAASSCVRWCDVNRFSIHFVLGVGAAQLIRERFAQAGGLAALGEHLDGGLAPALIGDQLTIPLLGGAHLAEVHALRVLDDLPGWFVPALDGHFAPRWRCDASEVLLVAIRRLVMAQVLLRPVGSDAVFV